MTSDQTMNAVLAVILGSVVAVLLLIPVAAVQYRRDGRLGPGDLVTLLAAAVYGLALWTYTLLPMPATGDFTCTVRQLELLGSFRPLFEEGFDGTAALLRSSTFQQLALNVVLFIPFGFFVRRIMGRGFVVATVLGLAMSLLIETTQGTGVWGLYDCPYRLFDVDDLLANTVGAFIGAVVSKAFVARPPKDVRLPERVSLGRRWMGMLCDLLFVGIVSVVAQVAYRGWCAYLGDGLDSIDPQVQGLLGFGLPGLLQLVVVLVLGRTVGEWTVDLRTVARWSRLVLVSRTLKFALGVGPLIALAWSNEPFTGPALGAFVLLTALAAIPGRDHPGLANRVSGLRLEVDLPPSPRVRERT